MSLLTPQQPTPPPKEQKLANRVRMIRNLSAQSYKQISEIQKRGIRLLWNDDDLTPQEIIDALGTDAVKIFQYHGGLTQYLAQVAQAEDVQPDIAFPTKAFTVEDGVITVLNEPYVP
jgi:hypothetical protein